MAGRKREVGKRMRDGQTLNGINQEKGRLNRCYWRNSEYRLASKCPLRGAPRKDSGSVTPPRGSRNRASYVNFDGIARACAGGGGGRALTTGS